MHGFKINAEHFIVIVFIDPLRSFSLIFFSSHFFQFGNEAWKDWWFVRMLPALNSSAWNVWNILLCSYLNIVWANDFFSCLMSMSYFSSSMIEWMLWIFCVQNEREPDGTDRKGKRAEDSIHIECYRLNFHIHVYNEQIKGHKHMLAKQHLSCKLATMKYERDNLTNIWYRVSI